MTKVLPIDVTCNKNLMFRVILVVLKLLTVCLLKKR